MRICIFGDSIVHGVMDAEMGGWANRLMCYFQEHWDEYEVSVYPLGIDGDTTSGLLKRFDVEASARLPDCIVFAIGINDAVFREGDRVEIELKGFEKNIEELHRRAREYTQTKIVCVGCTPVDDTKLYPYVGSESGKCYTSKRIQEYDARLKTTAERLGAHYISCADVISPFEDLSDGLHPNAEGHRKLFEHIRDELIRFSK
jgi:lysophospholipase L1-like esterase